MNNSNGGEFTYAKNPTRFVLAKGKDDALDGSGLVGELLLAG